MKENFKLIKSKLIAVTNLLLFSIFFNSLYATDYYVASGGNDGNSGTSSSTPWQTIDKLNSALGSLSPGDNVFFNRGDIFYGSISIGRSGSSGSPITFGAYGTGAIPVITGFTNVNSWVSLGGNIWQSSSSVSTIPATNMVAVNGVNTAMGRYPNSGYFTYQSFSGNTSITSSNLSGSQNWTGAEVVIKKSRWNTDRNKITSQSGGTLTFNAASSVNGRNNFGFFIQNDTRTLDQSNEWYFDPNTKKIQIYNSSTPSNIQVASLDQLVNLNGYNYISFTNLSFQGDNQSGIVTKGGSHITIQNCDFNFSGLSAINAYPNSPYLVIQNCSFNNSNDFAINASVSENVTIQNNSINNTGINPGMGQQSGASFTGIRADGNYGNISYNSILNTGFNALEFDGDATSIQDNYINTFGFVMDDGGGIYTFPEQGLRIYKQRNISNNIVINSLGAGDGTDDPSSNQETAIYLDGSTSNIDIIGNTAANTNIGIFLNNAHEVNITSNTSYNNYWQFYFRNYNSQVPMTNVSLNKNIFVSRDASQLVIHSELLSSSMPSTFSADNNYYARPIDDSLTLQTGIVPTGANYYRTLAQWQSFTGQDAHSNKSPKTISTVNDLRFEYNNSNSNKTVNLDANYIDIKGNSYNGTITLAPYSSSVLIKNGALSNQPPVADAGSDGTIILPTNSVNLSGSGTDASGTITGYNWTQFSGPTTSSIASPNTANTSITGLVQGIYQFQLQVTDNNGASGTSLVQIKVVASSDNMPPVANAGDNGSITLPTNFVSLSGSGTDKDGTITGYQWSQYSGPSQGTIVTPNLAKTTITGLTQGTYQFQLQVTDNNGATATSLVTIYVVSGSNSAPVAYAGDDGTITLPTNLVYLSGSGTDKSGTITSYQWSQYSGPSQGAIVTPNSTKTTVTGLTQGTYQFQLQVTDNNGATATSLVTIYVVNGSNIAPAAYAGDFGTITLPTNLVYLSGSGTDKDGTITSYQWSQYSGPSQGTIVTPNLAKTVVTGLTQGTYQFQLQVTDNNGAIATSLVTIYVVSGSNSAPVAYAGDDGTITLPTNLVYLSGSGTDKSGTITSYQWSQYSGPSQGTIVTPNSTKTTVTGLTQGTYQFQLQVTDNNGATATSLVTIYVVNGSNIAPAAYAGDFGTITLPTNLVYLSGSGTDKDGTITSYQWSQYSGPSQGTIVTPNSAKTVVTGLTQGTYQFQLQVTDNNGATATSLVTIYVVNSGLSASTLAPAISESQSSPLSLLAYPNPFVDHINVTITGGHSGEYSLILINNAGQTLWSKTENINSGSSELSINTSTLKRGIYYLKVVQGDSAKTLKLVK